MIAKVVALQPAERNFDDYVDEYVAKLPPELHWLTDRVLAGNELWRVCALFVCLLLSLIIGKIARFFLNSAARRLRGHRRILAAVGLESIGRGVVFASLVLGLQAGLAILRLNSIVAGVAATTVSILETIAIGYVLYAMVNVVDEGLRNISSRTASRLDDMLAPLIRKSLRGTVVVLVLVQIATILSDKPATSIIAGLGVGGLAIGLAAQDTIKNFFGSLMIFSDRPFEMGDEIKVDSVAGSVEAVGFRSTRFRTGDGHIVTIPNGELANKTIINVSKRGAFSRTVNLNLSLDSTTEQIALAIEIVRDALANHEGQSHDKPPRVFFADFGPNSLVLTAQYWFHPADWWKFIALGEKVNLSILRRFREHQIELVNLSQK